MQKKHIAGLAACLVLPVLLAAVVWLFLWTRIPDEIYAEEGTSLEGLLSYPLDEVIEEEVVTVLGQDSSNIPQGQVRICCSLFGVIPVKDVETLDRVLKKVWAGGEPVGIYMKTDGVLVVGTGRLPRRTERFWSRPGILSDPAIIFWRQTDRRPRPRKI